MGGKSASLMDSLAMMSLVAIIFVVLLVVLGPPITKIILQQGNSHGLEKHGQQYIDAQKCFDEGGDIYTLTINPRKKIEVCFKGEKMYLRVWRFLHLLATEPVWEERTAYLKDTIRSLAELAKVAAEQGWILETGGIR